MPDPVPAIVLDVMDAVRPLDAPSSQVGRGRMWLAVGIAGVIVVGVVAGVWQSRSGGGTVGATAARVQPYRGRALSSVMQERGPVGGSGSVLTRPWRWRSGGPLPVTGRQGARFSLGLRVTNATASPLTITGVHADVGVIRLVRYSAAAYGSDSLYEANAPVIIGDLYRPAVFHPYRVIVAGSFGLRLDFAIGSCQGYSVGSHLIYDRTVTVDFTQAGQHYTTQVASAPLAVTVTNHC
jgi:hypothetical protein